MAPTTDMNTERFPTYEDHTYHEELIPLEEARLAQYMEHCVVHCKDHHCTKMVDRELLRRARKEHAEHDNHVFRCKCVRIAYSPERYATWLQGTSVQGVRKPPPKHCMVHCRQSHCVEVIGKARAKFQAVFKCTCGWDVTQRVEPRGHVRRTLSCTF